MWMLSLGGCDQLFQLSHVDDPAAGGSDAVVDTPRPDGEPTGCPSDYSIRLQTTASLYRLVLTTENWSTAEGDCADDAPMGGTHLIILSNQQEWLSLITMPPTFLFDDTWIGATARKNGGIDFQWVTAENTGGFVVPATPGSSPWESDQPSSDGQCGELRASGSLHDEDCSNPSNYICECDGHPEVPANF
jgi:hypothetical protein